MTSFNDNYANLSNKLEIITQKLEQVQTKLEKLEKLENIYENTKRMNEHITFVESTYDSVKTPFNYLMNKVKILSYNPFKKLEENEESNESNESNERYECKKCNQRNERNELPDID